MPGEMTGQFGEWLSAHMQNAQPANTVFYDHGDPTTFGKVAHISGFVGDELNRRTQLAQIDVLVVNKKNEVLLLIEIEESDFRPKLILGDIFSILMCEQFSVRPKQNFTITDQTKLVVAGVAPNPNRAAKIEKVILPRLQQFSVPANAVRLPNVQIIFGSNVESTVEKLKHVVKQMFPYPTLENKR